MTLKYGVVCPEICLLSLNTRILMVIFLKSEKIDREELSEEEVKSFRDAAKERRVKSELENIEKAKILPEEKNARMQRYVAEMIKDDIKLSWNDFVELAIKFANEKDEEFYRFIRANYDTLKRPGREMVTYMPPAASVVSMESLIGIAAAIGIGIGWVWIWLAVSPYSTIETKAP
jgi:hypothetical protein